MVQGMLTQRNQPTQSKQGRKQVGGWVSCLVTGKDEGDEFTDGVHSHEGIV